MNIKTKKLSAYLKYLISTIFIFILYVIAIFAISFLCWKFDVPMVRTSVLYYVACVAGTSLNAFMFAVMSHSKGWLKGILGGIVFLLAVYLFGYLLCNGEVDNLRFVYKLPLFAVLSLACGVFGINFRN